MRAAEMLAQVTTREEPPRVRPPGWANPGPVLDVVDGGALTKADLPTAAAVNEAHEAASRAACNALDHAIRCGAMLVELKGALRHGAFGEWIAKNCTFGERTAQGYMRVAREVNTEKRNAVADLSLRNTLKAIAAPREPAEPSKQSTATTLPADAIARCERALARELARGGPQHRDDVIARIEEFLARAKAWAPGEAA